MARKLLIFGNGLGRSINNDVFDLRSAMTKIWQDDDFLSREEKRQIVSALDGVDQETGPSREDQLLGAQLALIACDILEKVAGRHDLQHWLTSTAIGYPSALQRYVFKVATYFHGYVAALDFDARWHAFARSLVGFINETKSHVATLNYDDLLYGPFNDGVDVNGQLIKLCRGYSGVLIDGWTRGSGFSYENMKRRNEDQTAYYLHLHGSPLYIDGENGGATKITRAQLNQNSSRTSRHIVLTHGSMKPLVISNSFVLRMYWDHLGTAIKEVDEIILFGYSGADDHLNKFVRRNKGSVSVRVVERIHADQDREVFWKRKIGDGVSVHSIGNVLNFVDW